MRHTNRQPAPEKCAGCGTSVTVTGYTTRSRYSKRPWCDRCGPADAPDYFTADPYPIRTRVPKSREVLEHQVQRALGLRRIDGRLVAGGDQRTAILRRLAYHEAGHVVAARVLGLPIREVDIDHHGGGRTSLHADQAPDGWGPTDDAVILLAGTLAERTWCPDADTEGTEDDEAALRDLMSGDNPPEVRAARILVERILTGRAGDLEVLVEALVAHRRLSGEQVEQLLGRAADMPGYPAGMTQDSAQPQVDRWQAKVRELVAAGTDPTPRNIADAMAAQLADLLGLDVTRPAGRANLPATETRAVLADPIDDQDFAAWWQQYGRNGAADADPKWTRQAREAAYRMNRAGDRRDWATFRHWQSRLADIRRPYMAGAA